MARSGSDSIARRVADRHDGRHDGYHDGNLRVAATGPSIAVIAVDRMTSGHGNAVRMAPMLRRSDGRALARDGRRPAGRGRVTQAFGLRQGVLEAAEPHLGASARVAVEGDRIGMVDNDRRALRLVGTTVG